MEKVPGPDRITNELIRGPIEEKSPILTQMFKEIVHTGIIPSKWAESHISYIRKVQKMTSETTDLHLISNVYKIFAKKF